MFDIAEEHKQPLLNYIISREMSLGFIRMTWCIVAALVVTYYGTIAVGWLFIIAGISALGFRRL